MFSLVFVCAFSLLNIGECGFFKPPCDSPIFCYGDLLKSVQLLQVLHDRRAYFTLKMKYPEDVIVQNFKNFKLSNNLTKENVRDFVFLHFEDSNALQDATPEDYVDNPSFLNEIANVTIRTFAGNLHQIWPKLTRQFSNAVLENPSLYSYIPVPNEFIIPGGRFNEYYYWDSYWVVEGLLISGMHETVRKMIENFIYLVRNYGFVPNGGKIYYLNRSQPPLLIHMAYLYVKRTGNIYWLKKNVDYLADELQYWLRRKLVFVETGEGISYLAQYVVRHTDPRPESYLNDYRTASVWHADTRKQQTYMNIKSVAESGWDFSSRWTFDRRGNVSYNISHVQTHRIIPVDLNAYLCGGFYKIAELYEVLQRRNASGFWRLLGDQWLENINDLLWNSQDQIWYDYDIKLRKHRKSFYPSNVAPLWAGCYTSQSAESLGKSVVNYLKNENVLNYPGGIPTSKMPSGQQWDFPNAFPPLQHLVVYALMNSHDSEAQRTAENLARKWVNANVYGFKKYGEMFEKYDVREAGLYGGGGEYPVQAGFGWSNGVALRFIYDFYRY